MMSSAPTQASETYIELRSYEKTTTKNTSSPLKWINLKTSILRKAMLYRLFGLPSPVQKFG